MTEVAIQSLVKRYQGFTAVDGISVTVRHGEFVSLLGPSGCGKTTTLKCIAGFESADAGSILFDGTDVSLLPPERRDIGMVFQSYALFPHLTVTRNLAFGLEMRRIGKAAIAKRVAGVLDLVQLGGLGERYPRELSGGQQQRVALARALVIEPRILLLDEPLANLDAKLRDEMRTFIRDLQRRVGITTLYVTHDQSEAMTMSDRIVVMFKGRIAQVARPETIYHRPADADVAGFVGRANIFSGTVMTGPDGVLLIETGAGRFRAPGGFNRPAGSTSTIMVRPEAIRLAPMAQTAAQIATPSSIPPSGGLIGRIIGRYFHGAHIDYHVRVGEQTVTVQSGLGFAFEDGTEVMLAFDPERLWDLSAGMGAGAQP